MFGSGNPPRDRPMPRTSRVVLPRNIKSPNARPRSVGRRSQTRTSNRTLAKISPTSPSPKAHQYGLTLPRLMLRTCRLVVRAASRLGGGGTHRPSRGLRLSRKHPPVKASVPTISPGTTRPAHLSRGPGANQDLTQARLSHNDTAGTYATPAGPDSARQSRTNP